MNRLKDALADGRTQLGLWLALANSYTAEICAGAGFDWLLVDEEHAPNTITSIIAQLQAIAPYPVEPVVRVASGDDVAIKKVLDIGFTSLLVPMVESGDQAEALVRATRYPPEGVRGVAATTSRATRWGRDADYLREAADRICLIVQVENKAGIEAIDDIAATKGIDCVFIGPADLAASLGHLGNPAHPEVQDAIEHAMARIRNAGKAIGVLSGDRRAIDRYRALGAGLVAVGTDVTVLARGAEDLAAHYR